MRHILLFILLTCFGKIFSQNRFSITPTLENSFQRTKIENGDKFLNNQLYVLKKRAFTHPYRFSPLSIGILFNYSLRNNWKISVGISQSDAMIGYNIYFQSINTFKNPIDTTVSANRISVNNSGVAMTKFPLLISKNVCTNDSIKLFFKKPILCISFDLFGGISYMTKPRGTSTSGMDLLWSGGMDSILIYPNQYLSYESTLFSFRGNSLAYNIGFTVSFKTASKKEIFSVRSYYTYAHRVHAFESVRISINNTHYVHTFSGTGTGISIQLSRSFNIPKRNKKAFLK